MKRLTKIPAVAQLGCLLLLFSLWGCSKDKLYEAQYASPYGSHVVRVREKPDTFIDFNFNLFLESHDGATNKVTLLFSSPDEGIRRESDHVLWSRDSRYFLFLGKDVSVEHESWLEDGTAMYIFCDIRTTNLWCNASQQRTFPNFSYSMLTNIQWSAPLPKPRVTNSTVRQP